MVVAQCLQTERCSEISSSPCFVSSSTTQFHSCAMMGLQATSGKRKLEGGVGCMDFDMELGESPSKLGRVEASWWAMDDSYGASSPTASYYDMEIVTPPCLQSSASCQLSGSGPTSAAAAGATSPSSLAASPQSPVSPQSPAQAQQQAAQQQQQQQSQQQVQQQQSASQHQHYYQRPGTPQAYPTQQQQQQSQQQQQQQQSSQQQQQQQASSQQQQQLSRPQPSQWGHHAAAPHHYEPPTIRREENGKSYLELGSSYRANERCCEGSRSSWCRRGRACYRQRRLAVLNISMCKLARYRQFPDPSLHRSVLICNTLRYLEREMERDRSPPPMEPVMATAPHHMAQLQLQQPEQGRLTPFPVMSTTPGSGGASGSSPGAAETDVDSGIGDSDDSRSINWGSVLSLSSQSPLDPLNNNELLDVDIGPELDLDFMPGWKLAPLPAQTNGQSATTTTTTTPATGTTVQTLTTTTTTSALVDEQLHSHHSLVVSNSSSSSSSSISSSTSSSSSSSSGSCNSSSSSSSSSSSTTHESLMCVGS